MVSRSFRCLRVSFSGMMGLDCQALPAKAPPGCAWNWQDNRSAPAENNFLYNLDILKQRNFFIMDEAPIKVGVVGVGYLGRFHAEKYAHLQDTELVGVADLNQARAVDVAQALGTRAYTDYRELLPEVAAVSVAVPTSGHFEVVQQALAAGCHVLVEKPISVTVAEADELVRLAR